MMPLYSGLTSGPVNFFPMMALAPFFVLIMLWSLFWKGLALWHAGQHKQPWWFAILLVVNTAGILEIVYLFLVLKVKAADLFKK